MVCPQQAFCEQVLQKIASEKGFAEPRFEFAPGCQKGDNVVATVLRCTVTDNADSTKKLHLMVKLAPENPVQRAKFRVDECFKIEAVMYDKVFPAFANLLKEKGRLQASDIFPGIPRTYAVLAEGEEMMIVMDDLRHRGFVMQDRKVGLDVAHCSRLLQRLAALHAASLALQKDNPQLHETLVGQLREVMFANQVPATFTKAIEYSRSFIEERFPIGTIERDKFERYAERSSEFLMNAVRRNDTLSCITHGDLLVNNVLFKYRPGSAEPDEVCLVDFQISRMASPILDLSYFFCLCTRKDTRKSFLSLVKTYHDSLSSQLSALGHDPSLIAPWDVLMRELKKYFGFGWACAAKMLPRALLDEQGMREYEKQFFADTKDATSFVVPKNADDLKTVLSDLLDDLVELGCM